MGRYTREVDEVITKPRSDTTSGVAKSDPQVHGLLQMQQVLGNRHVQRVMGGGSGRTGLPGALRARVEQLSGESLADVQVHYDSPKPARLGALAYTRGSEIHVGPGQERHLAHEAWHVVQQKQGRVQPTMQAANQPINDDRGLEHEADRMGERASSLQAPPGALGPARARAARGPGRPVIQRLSVDREPRNGTQIQLRHTKWAREWKLALRAEDGAGAELCSILFKLETKFKGGLPKLSVDTMQARTKSRGSGSELLASIPWAVQQIVTHNPLATRWGKLALHSGFANIVAYQMAVKKYAESLELRDTTEWDRRRAEAVAAMTVDEVEEVVDDDEVASSEKHEEEHEEEPAPLVPQKTTRRAYDMARFPELWADTHVLIGSGLFTINAGLMDLTSAANTLTKLERSGKLLIDNFGAAIDVNDLSELKANVEELQEQAKQAIELSETADEKIEY